MATIADIGDGLPLGYARQVDRQRISMRDCGTEQSRHQHRRRSRIVPSSYWTVSSSRPPAFTEAGVSFTGLPSRRSVTMT